MTQDFLFLEVEVLFCKSMLVQLGKQPYVKPKNQGLLLILKKKKKNYNTGSYCEHFPPAKHSIFNCWVKNEAIISCLATWLPIWNHFWSTQVHTTAESTYSLYFHGKSPCLFKGCTQNTSINKILRKYGKTIQARMNNQNFKNWSTEDIILL